MTEALNKPPGGSAKASRSPKLRYQDRPEVSEVFSDSIHSCVFDGQALRVEFTVARFDDPSPLGFMEGRQVPVSRLILNRSAIADLFNRLGQLSESFKTAGLMPETSPSGAVRKN